jgi:hypothetical protein
VPITGSVAANELAIFQLTLGPLSATVSVFSVPRWQAAMAMETPSTSPSENLFRLMIPPKREVGANQNPAHSTTRDGHPASHEFRRKGRPRPPNTRLNRGE